MDIYRVTKDSPEWQRKAYDYVRIDAFSFGQNIPVETEFNHDDPNEEYRAVIFVEDHKPVAGLRITYLDKNTARIGRVCVVREKQKSGYGKILIAEAEKWIKEDGASHIFITSQDRAAKFYEKCGYTLNPNINPDSFDSHKSQVSPEERERKRKELGFVCVTMERDL